MACGHNLFLYYIFCTLTVVLYSRNKILHTLRIIPKITIQITLLWSCLSLLTQQWSLWKHSNICFDLHAGRCGYSQMLQCVADASSMQWLVLLFQRGAWHFFCWILSALFRFHLTHLLLLLCVPLNFISRFDRLFIGRQIQPYKQVLSRVRCDLNGCVWNEVQCFLLHVSQMTHCLVSESLDCSFWE